MNMIENISQGHITQSGLFGQVDVALRNEFMYCFFMANNCHLERGFYDTFTR